MARPVVKATTPISAAGNNPRRSRGRAQWRAAGGFTLLELLVVLAVVAVGSALVTLALPQGRMQALERDGQRLAAQLEAARAQSRAAGVPVIWRPRPGGFEFLGLPPEPEQARTQQWLDPDTRAQGADTLVLGPDPIIAAQRVLLGSSHDQGLRLSVATDGLQPFRVERLP